MNNPDSTQQKDYFSDHSKVYATFRPTYPNDLYEFIFSHLKHKSIAWDCATGNGQVASFLSNHFEKVYATDISQQQLDNAFQAPNISYSVSPAEKTSFKENTFDLITVGQAFHWFHAHEFYNEVNRVAKPGALLALWGYALCHVNSKVDDLFIDFYRNTVGPYWDSARKMVEDEYKDIKFPFQEIPSPKFQITVEWTLDHYTGYLTSWSATQKYIKAKGDNPLPVFRDKLNKFWKEDETKTISFPVFLRLGIIQK